MRIGEKQQPHPAIVQQAAGSVRADGRLAMGEWHDA
jgi:hypothetical protein